MIENGCHGKGFGERSSEIAALTLPQFAAAIALFLPGFVSLKVDRLIQPGKPANASELAVDALAYSLLNAALLGWAVWLAAANLNSSSPNYTLLWGYGILVCVAGPTLWPFLFRTAQRFGARGIGCWGRIALRGIISSAETRLAGSSSTLRTDNSSADTSALAHTRPLNLSLATSISKSCGGLMKEENLSAPLLILEAHSSDPWIMIGSKCSMMALPSL
jgi:hypothetical protein